MSREIPVAVPVGAQGIGSPPYGWKLPFGRVETIGQLKAIIWSMADDMPLMVRNGPLPFLSFHFSGDTAHLEFE
jgi:hypothetical protein